MRRAGCYRRPMTKLVLLFAICLSVLTVSEGALAQAVPSPGPQASAALRSAPSWSVERESWYRRNRVITITGKVAAVVGVVTLFTGAFMDNVGALASGATLEYGGLATWAGCDLKATNRFRSWGYRIRKPAAIVSVIGVFAGTPATIVAGSIQSARIRELHGDILGAVAPPPSESLRMTGAGFRLSF
jgi:hypothetical protein